MVTLQNHLITNPGSTTHNMARGHPTSPPDAVSLPKVSFTIVSDEISKLPAGVKNKAAIPFGCGSFGFKSDFEGAEMNCEQTTISQISQGRQVMFGILVHALRWYCCDLS